MRITLCTFWTFKKIFIFIYLAVLSLAEAQGISDLRCGMWDLFHLTRDGSQPPALGVWSLSPWTTREVPGVVLRFYIYIYMGFPCGSADKESTCNVGDLSSIPGLGRYPGEEKGYPLQYSGLENSMDCVV